MRASQLELTAHYMGCRSLATRMTSAAPDRPWQTRWPHGHRTTGHQVLASHGSMVNAVAAGALSDGAPVVIGGGSGMVRVWRTADSTPLVPPRDLPESVRAVAVHGGGIITAAGTDIAVHQPALPWLMR